MSTTTTNPLAALAACQRDDCEGGHHLHWSALKHLQTSPLHFRHNLEHPRADSAAMRLGRAIHAAALEPLRLGREYVVYDGQRRGKAWTDFRAQHEGREILTRAEWDKAEGAVQALHARRIPWLVNPGLTEHVMSWIEHRAWLPCAGRVDRVVDGTLVEVKSTGRWGNRVFGNSAGELLYHAQIAWYCEGLRACGIECEDRAVIVAVEVDPPHDVAVYRVTDEQIKAGRQLVTDLIEHLRVCLELDHWPGVAETETVLQLPPWAMPEEEPTHLAVIGEDI